MKRFLIRTVLLFIVPVFLGLATCEYFLRKIPNDYRYKNEWLTKNCDDVEIIVLGSSHTYRGVNPIYFSHRAFNAAHSAQGIKYDYFIFNKFINKMDSLKVVILPLSYFSMVSTQPGEGWDDWRIKYYNIYYGCNYNKKIKYCFEIFPKIKVKTVFRSILGKENHLYIDSLGFAPKDNYLLKKEDSEWMIDGLRVANIHTRYADSALVLENERQLIEIIQTCRKRKISVILLTTPTYKTYRDNLKTEQLEIMFKYGHLFESKFDNVHYINLLDSDCFVQEDFQNSDHLNAFGAEKLTTLLDHYIDSLQLIK